MDRNYRLTARMQVNHSYCWNIASPFSRVWVETQSRLDRYNLYALNIGLLLATLRGC